MVVPISQVFFQRLAETGHRDSVKMAASATPGYNKLAGKKMIDDFPHKTGPVQASMQFRVRTYNRKGVGITCFNWVDVTNCEGCWDLHARSGELWPPGGFILGLMKWELCITTLVEPWFRGVEDGHDQNTWVINLQNVVGLLIIGFWVKQSGKDGTKQNWSWMAIHTMLQKWCTANWCRFICYLPALSQYQTLQLDLNQNSPQKASRIANDEAVEKGTWIHEIPTNMMA